MADMAADVLVIGTGPAGSATAALLASYGVENMVVNRYRWLANTPRAHITNQRTMEVLRDLGREVEDEAYLFATPQHLMSENIFCESRAGEEIGRMNSWGTHPLSKAEHLLSSPTVMNDLPQTFMEPLLFKTACARGTQARMSTEYVSHVQDAEAVTTLCRDPLTGKDVSIRSRYLVGANGGNSLVAEHEGLPFEGNMGVGGSMNILFRADLSKYVAHRPSVLYWVMQPGADVGGIGIGMGLVRMVRPWNQWLIVWGYDITQPAPTVDAAPATQVARQLVGDPGLGSNTSIQDAFDLAWKLAAVIKGQAGAGLLESYSKERAPTARQIVTRTNRSIGEFGPIFQALGMTGGTDYGQIKASMEARCDATAAGAAQRAALREATAFKKYEFDAHGVEMNQRYRSDAVVTDGQMEPAFDLDGEMHYQPTTWPGARLPHVWLFDEAGGKLSTLDLCGGGRFSLFTGIGGEEWVAAAAEVGAEIGLELVTRVIGPRRGLLDHTGDWARAREVSDAGCVLVRPDQHVAWRSEGMVESAAATLRRVLKKRLAR